MFNTKPSRIFADIAVHTISAREVIKSDESRVLGSNKVTYLRIGSALGFSYPILKDSLQEISLGPSVSIIEIPMPVVGQESEDTLFVGKIIYGLGFNGSWQRSWTKDFDLGSDLRVGFVDLSSGVNPMKNIHFRQRLIYKFNSTLQFQLQYSHRNELVRKKTYLS